MYIILVGADSVGASLARLAAKDGHNVVLIERDEKLARQVSEQLDISVLNSDIATHGIMEEAGAKRADAVIATTKDDATNLMAMFLGAEAGVKGLVSVVNDPGHAGLFERLEVHVLLDPEEVVARHLYGVLNQPKVEEMVLLEEDEEVFGVVLSPQSVLVGRSLKEIRGDSELPRGFAIVAIKRGDERRLAKDDEAMEAGDRLTVYSLKPVKPSELKLFVGDEGT